MAQPSDTQMRQDPAPGQGMPVVAEAASSETILVATAAPVPSEVPGPSSQAQAGLSRTVQVFRPPNVSAGTSPSSSFRSAGTGEEEAKPTPAELKQAFKDHMAQRHGPDAPLMTKSMREKEEARLGKQKKTWNEVKIRVRFADRTQLESTFPANAQMSDIYTFVRESLHPDVLSQNKKFTLFTAPPRKDYAETDPKIKGKGLAELGLVPAAVISVRWEDAALNSTTRPAPLKPELLSSAQDLPPPKNFDQPAAAKGNKSDRTLGSGSADGESSKARDPKAMPKWLKGLTKK